MLVAGVDSSTQSCKVLVVDADTGEIVRKGSAPHPDGTEVNPAAWWAAWEQASAAAGGIADVAALSVGGQQHGMVCLDANGDVVRPALLWNDTRSAQAAADLADELGPQAWAEATGTVPVASITATKLRWLAEHEPTQATRVAAVALPHDWLTWKLRGTGALEDLVTDRSEASGTGYFDAAAGGAGEYRRDLLRVAFGRDDLILPRVLGPAEGVESASGTLLGPGAGDNAAAALGLGLAPGSTSVSLGTSGVVGAVSSMPTHDPTGMARVLDATARLLGVDHEELSRRALAAECGAAGLSFVPYVEGERTPNLPHARGVMDGVSLASMTRENVARAAVEGLLCLLADAMDAVRALGVDITEVSLVGGAARAQAVRTLAPALWCVRVIVPEPGEYVALGAARQAAWVATGALPHWAARPTEILEAEPTPEVLERYRALVATRR